MSNKKWNLALLDGVRFYFEHKKKAETNINNYLNNPTASGDNVAIAEVCGCIENVNEFKQEE